MIYAHSALCFDQRGSPACTERQWWLLLIRCCLGPQETRLVSVLNHASQTNFENEASVCGSQVQPSRLQQFLVLSLDGFC